jgi:hypothetical protein
MIAGIIITSCRYDLDDPLKYVLGNENQIFQVRNGRDLEPNEAEVLPESSKAPNAIRKSVWSS